VLGCASVFGGAGNRVALAGLEGVLDIGAAVLCAAGSDGGWESADCCAAALRESSNPAVTIHFVLRMTLISVFL